jgi:hypothetical protein
MAEALPYRVAGDTSVRAGAWTLVRDGEVGPIPAWIEAWDYSMSVHVSRQIEIDPAALRDDTGLQPQDVVQVAVTWRVAGSLLNGATMGGVPIGLDDASTVVEIGLELPGTDLGPALELETTLLLTAPAGSRSGPVAHRPGSVLWRDTKRLKLLGDESQFPMAIVDFAAQGLAARGPWTLLLGSDLEAPVMGQAQLLVNTAFPTVVAAVREGDGPSAAAIRSTLGADVGRMLVERALVDDEVVQRSDWPDESLGQVLRALVISRIGGSFQELKLQMKTDPIAWSARMSETFRLFAEAAR